MILDHSDANRSEPDPPVKPKRVTEPRPEIPRHFSALCLLLVAAFLTPASLPAEPAQGLVLPFREVSVASPVQEVIREVTVEEGDPVEKDQVLARLADEKEALDVEQYEKLIERREFEAKGMEALLKDKMTSKDVALEKKTELEMARIQHAIAVERLKEKTIRAPLSGIVVKKHKESGEAVDRVEPVLDIVNIDKVYVQFYLDPKLLPGLREGLSMKVDILSGPGRETRDATVAFLDPRIDAASGLFRVKLQIDNPDHRIKAGMRAEADFSSPGMGN